MEETQTDIIENLKALALNVTTGEFNDLVATFDASLFTTKNVEPFEKIMMFIFYCVDPKKYEDSFMSTAAFRNKNRHTVICRTALTWLAEIKKTLPPKEVPYFGESYFKMPFDERCMRFLLWFTEYAMTTQFTRLASEFYDQATIDAMLNQTDEEVIDNQIRKIEMDRKQFADMAVNDLQKLEEEMLSMGQELQKLDAERNANMAGFTQSFNRYTSENKQGATGQAPFSSESRMMEIVNEYCDICTQLEPLVHAARRFDETFKAAFTEKTMSVSAKSNPGSQYFVNGKLQLLKVLEDLQVMVETLGNSLQSSNDSVDYDALKRNICGYKSTIETLYTKQKILFDQLNSRIAQKQQSIESLRDSISRNPRPQLTSNCNEYTEELKSSFHDLTAPLLEPLNLEDMMAEAKLRNE